MPQTDPNSFQTVFASGTISATTNSGDQKTSAAGGRFLLNITGLTGTSPTLTVKLQVKDPLSGNYIDLLNGAFATISATGFYELTVYPGIATAANQAVSYVLSGIFRAVATLGGSASPTATFSLSYIPLW